MNKNYFILSLIILILLFLVVVLLSNQPQSNQPNQPASPTTTQEAIITVTGSGFEPSTMDIKAGTKVIFMNKSGEDVSVNSDPHPAHTDFSALNLGIIKDNQSASLVFDKPGSYSYHNHLKPYEKGTIVVK